MNISSNELAKFIILYIGRCGSSYLQSLLDSHPEVAVEGELLHDGSVYKENGGYFNANNIYPQISKLRSSCKRINAIGFKLSIEHLNNSMQDLEVWHESARPCNIVHIYRNNKLEQYLSLLLALKNKAWTSAQGEYSINKVVVDLNYLVPAIEKWRGVDSILMDFVRARDGLSFAYESLLSDQELMLKNITNLLGVGGFIEKPASLFKRQRSLSIKATIENYEQVSDCLNSMGLGSYLQE